MILRGAYRHLVPWFSLCCLLLSGAARAEVTVTDAHGEHTFEQIPERVVTISWAMTENVIELGVTPVGVADIEGYNEWVVRPAVPDGVDDIGKRGEPSIEELAALKPDVIIISNGQEGLIDKLEQVAPVLYFNAFGAEQDNARAARRIFRETAKLFGQEERAQRKLDAMDARFDELRQQLHDHFGEALPPVTGVRFNNQSVVFIYGANALSQYALNHLGIEPAMDIPPSQWGIAQKKLTSLSQMSKDSVLLYFKPAPGVERLFESPLWQAMPVARAGHVAGVESTWSYGGAMSIRYLAEAMTDALLTIEP
ncbi:MULTISPECIES: iron-siderophore ABC transporter substrate-binding protein [Marinobacter]|uniref:ABC transporter substrate-binding protein n=1 Tax=Marinobacter TaxID=2742 RepID=UPI000DABF2F3|nr:MULTISPECIES: iron-siderophore ABC transporter substrate-binding protein [Marinobacter]